VRVKAKQPGEVCRIPMDRLLQRFLPDATIVKVHGTRLMGDPRIAEHVVEGWRIPRSGVFLGLTLFSADARHQLRFYFISPP
jgi:hypothetical protein